LGVVDEAGTRGFAAPEQLRSPHLVDARADLYAIGRVVQECLLGRGITSIPLATVVGHLVVDDPLERYSSSAALAEDLARVSRGEVPLGPRGTGEKPPSTLFVGRSRELEHLRARWREARNQRGGVLV